MYKASVVFPTGISLIPFPIPDIHATGLLHILPETTHVVPSQPVEGDSEPLDVQPSPMRRLYSFDKRGFNGWAIFGIIIDEPRIEKNTILKHGLT